MPLNPSTPLLAMLNAEARTNSNWQVAAIDACRQSIMLIDSISKDSPCADRDVRVCLDAVRNSLTWVLDQPVSEQQVHATMTRAIKIFQSVEFADLSLT